jgi:hypothetical protein
MEIKKSVKKSAIGRSSVTLVADDDVGATRPAHLEITSLVITTPGVPPSEFWGTAVADGRKYDVIIRARS